MDRRRFVREFTASGIELSDLEGNFICSANINDISEGGLLVVFYCEDKTKFFTTGKMVKFNMKIPTGAISGVAEVVWSNLKDSQLGLKFTKIENADGFSNLMSFVASGFI